jgi:hypothetical protein
MKPFWELSAIVSLGVLAAQSSPAQTVYTIGNLSSWGPGQQITGCQLTSGGDVSVGQTFSLPGNAQVNSITVPVFWNYSGASQNQPTFLSVNIMAWDGSEPTGPVLYQGQLGNYNIPGIPSLGTIPGWQTFSGSPSNLILNQNQEYVLFLTAVQYINDAENFSTSAGYTDGSAYTGGQLVSYAGYLDSFNNLTTHSWTPTGSVDMAFSMQLTSVPEPSSAALACVGGLLIWLRRRASGDAAALKG